MIQAAATVLEVRLPGRNTDIARDDDYQTVLTFRCQAK